MMCFIKMLLFVFMRVIGLNFGNFRDKTYEFGFQISSLRNLESENGDFQITFGLAGRV